METPGGEYEDHVQPAEFTQHAPAEDGFVSGVVLVWGPCWVCWADCEPSSPVLSGGLARVQCQAWQGAAGPAELLSRPHAC